MRCQMPAEARWCRSSVVRMNSSFEQLLRRELLPARGLQHLHAVLVGAGEEEDVVAVEAHEAGDGVGRDRLVGMADMRRAVGIGDGGGEIVAGLVSHRSVPCVTCRKPDEGGLR
jgi:hypothetical protein